MRSWSTTWPLEPLEHGSNATPPNARKLEEGGYKPQQKQADKRILMKVLEITKNKWKLMQRNHQWVMAIV